MSNLMRSYRGGTVTNIRASTRRRCAIFLTSSYEEAAWTWHLMYILGPTKVETEYPLRSVSLVETCHQPPIAWLGTEREHREWGLKQRVGNDGYLKNPVGLPRTGVGLDWESKKISPMHWGSTRWGAIVQDENMSLSIMSTKVLPAESTSPQRQRGQEGSTLHLHSNCLNAIAMGRDTNRGKGSMISDKHSGIAVSIRFVVSKADKTRHSKKTARPQPCLRYGNNGGGSIFVVGR
ncbi:hypothetical protein EVAR_7402_1 [Eumeta japonica]|uniref:Uncharacterized protein n=1 Tax=Eumeta variegata TaxID=151549 RepID=A0A4C1V741_EUMVA|nr:hypothetical protein EVAR_7402_1 [Eumeta japonica]